MFEWVDMNLTKFVDVDLKEESELREFLDLNALARETISSHVWRWIMAERESAERNSVNCIYAPAWAHTINNLLDVFDAGHCVHSIEEPFRNEPI